MIYVILVAGVVAGGYYLGRHSALAKVKAEIAAIESAAVSDAKAVVARIKKLL